MCIYRDTRTIFFELLEELACIIYVNTFLRVFCPLLSPHMFLRDYCALHDDISLISLETCFLYVISSEGGPGLGFHMCLISGMNHSLFVQ